MEISSVIALVFAYVALQTARNFWVARRSIRNYPGLRVLINNSGTLGYLLKRPRRGFAVGAFRTWLFKHRSFEEYGMDIITAVSAFPSAEAQIWVADAAAAKELLTNRSCFRKAIEFYDILNIFGSNIISSGEDEWKRHRKVCAPAFSESNNALVWEETQEIMSDLFHDVWNDSDEVYVDNMTDLTRSIALYVISRAGFGRRIGWNSTTSTSSNRPMPFEQSLSIVTESLFLRAALPSWLYRRVPLQRIRHVRSAFEDFEMYMTKMIDARQQSTPSARSDIFNMLLEAVDDDVVGIVRLSQQELLGDIFMLLFAGHETTAHTMALAFGLLAIYTDEQDLLYQELKTVLSDRQALEYQDVHQLTRCAAFVNETLRMYPPVPSIPKRSMVNTSLTTLNSTGQHVTIPIPEGVDTIINIPALHYNPRYWKDPHQFRPARFLEEWDRDAFLPFVIGPRSCLGRRFAELELIAALCATIMKYRIALPDKEQRPGETLQERQERVLKCAFVLTLTPVRVPLVFQRR